MEQRGIRKRNDHQRIQDQDYLVMLMRDHPDLTALDYHPLLNAHIKEREKENSYELSYPMVARIIASIKQGYVKNAGINIQQELLDANERLEYLISIAADELANRLQDRIKVTVVTQDLVYGDISHLTEQEMAVLSKIELNVEKSRKTEEHILAGTGIESMISELDKLIKSKRSLLGLDAPKKIEKQVTKQHIFQSVSRDELVEVFNKLQLPTGPLIEYMDKTFKKRGKIGEEIQHDKDDE